MAVADNNKKEERQQRRAERQQKKIEKYKAGLSDQPSLDIGPLGSERKAEIDKRISQSVEEYVREGLQKFQSRYKAPDITAPAKPIDEPTIKDVRKAKRAKIADILTAFGRGLKGQKVDPTYYQDRLTRQRDEKFQQYKDVSQKGKQRLEEWEDYYMGEQIKYLESLKDKEISELKKKQIQSQIDATKALAENRRRKPASKKSGTGRVPFPTYEYKTDDGQTIKIPMEGEKKDLLRLNKAIQSAEGLKKVKEQIQKQMEAEIYRAEGTGILGFGKSKEEVQEEIRQKYADQLEKATSDVVNAEAQIKNIFERNLIGEDGQVIEPETIQQPTETEVKTEEDELWES